MKVQVRLLVSADMQREKNAEIPIKNSDKPAHLSADFNISVDVYNS
jgi:hypothetical protein